MKNLGGMFKVGKEVISKSGVNNALIKFVNKFNLKLYESTPEIKEKSLIVLTGTLQAINGNNLEYKESIANTIRSSLEGVAYSGLKVKVLFKVNCVGMGLPSMTVYNSENEVIVIILISYRQYLIHPLFSLSFGNLP